MPGLASFPGLDDTDRDGIANWRDNCTEVKNYEQADSDGDGYGDACDADFDNNGFVTTLDFGVFLQEFNSAEPSLCDHNGDGLVSGADFNIFMQYFGGVPGPSGLECAGTIPCTPWPQPANTPIASGTRPDR
jgi:hypothetical protein